MDEHKEKEDKFQESSEQQQPRKQEAEEQEHNSEESMDQHQEAYKEGRNSEEAKEATVVQLKEVEASSEEEASSPSSVLGIFAHPCSLLQYLLRACADWCWGLHGTFDDDPKPQAAAVVAPTEAVAPANSTEQGDGGGEKANYFYMQEVVTRVWAVRRGRPPGRPGHPREGSGGNGGIHH